MELAVLKYKDTSSPPAEIPGEWPAEVREIADGAALPGSTWVRMTVAGLEQHKAAYQADYDTWWTNNKSTYVSNTTDPYA